MTRTATATTSRHGASGAAYAYEVHSFGTGFRAVPGSRIFAKRDHSGRRGATYVGETSDLSERFDAHHKMPCIHAASSDGAARRREESDLIALLRPGCNG